MCELPCALAEAGTSRPPTGTASCTRGAVSKCGEHTDPRQLRSLSSRTGTPHVRGGKGEATQRHRGIKIDEKSYISVVRRKGRTKWTRGHREMAMV